MKKRNNKKIWVFIIIVIFIYGSYSHIHSQINTPVNADSSEQIKLVVKEGTSVKQLANTLHEKNLISNENIFTYYLKFTGNDTKILAGRFTISPAQNIREIVETLTSNDVEERVVTIPEGYSSKQINERLVSAGLIEGNEFLECIESQCSRKNYPEIPQTGSLEGYLFPDTYFVNNHNFTVQELLDKMLNNFHQKWESIPKTANRSTKDIIIMASLIEKEVHTDPDRPIVAGILWKRLDSEWALGVDATINYLTGKSTITSKDLQIDSPYNTRKYRGLPPTAISNPGLKSLKAAANPEKSQYWFYLTETGTGRVIYSTTNEQHNENKRRYL